MQSQSPSFPIPLPAAGKRPLPSFFGLAQAVDVRLWFVVAMVAMIPLVVIPYTPLLRSLLIACFLLAFLVSSIAWFRTALVVFFIYLPSYVLVRFNGETVLSPAYKELMLLALILGAVISVLRMRPPFAVLAKSRIFIMLLVAIVISCLTLFFHTLGDLTVLAFSVREKILPLLLLPVIMIAFMQDRQRLHFPYFCWLLFGATLGLAVVSAASFLNLKGFLTYPFDPHILEHGSKAIAEREVAGIHLSRMRVLFGFGTGTGALLLVMGALSSLYCLLYLQKKVILLVLVLAVSFLCLAAAGFSGSISAVLAVVVFAFVVAAKARWALLLLPLLAIPAWLVLRYMPFFAGGAIQNPWDYLVIYLKNDLSLDQMEFGVLQILIGFGPVVRSMYGDFDLMANVSERQFSWDASFLTPFLELGFFCFAAFLILYIMIGFSYWRNLRRDPGAVASVFLILTSLCMVHGFVLWTPVIGSVALLGMAYISVASMRGTGSPAFPAQGNARQARLPVDSAGRTPGRHSRGPMQPVGVPARVGQR